MPSNYKNKSFFKRFGFAMKGIYWAWKEENNFRIQVGIGLLVVLTGFLLKITALEWIIILVCIFLVLASEMFNAALEQLADVVRPGYDIRIGKLKDISAGAVLMLSIISAIIGGIIFLPYLIHLFR